MNYGEIKKCDIANGEGVRISLFVSGCTHQCPECFNSATWDFRYGDPFTKETEQELLEALEPGYIDGLTLIGGEPMEPQNQEALLPFVRRVKERFPEKTIWCYTGYLFDLDLLGKKLPDSRALASGTPEDQEKGTAPGLPDGPYISWDQKPSAHPVRCAATDELLSYLDVLVDGEFRQGLKNISLAFRGSSNQRILDVKRSLERGEIWWWKLK